MRDADVLRLVHDGEVEGRILAAGQRGCQRGEHPGVGDQLPRLQPAANPLEDGPQHRALRLRQPGLAAEAGDIAIRSQVSNCQASTTCSHSVSRKCRLNLWPPTAFGRFTEQFPHALAAGERDRPAVRLVEPKTDGIERVNVDAFAKARLAADQSFQLGVQRVRQRVGEGRQQHTRVGMCCGPDGRRGAAPRWSCRCRPSRRRAPGRCSRAPPIAAARGAGRPSISPTGNRGRACSSSTLVITRKRRCASG